MTSNTALVSLATSVPPYVFPQNKVASVARELFGKRYPEFERLSPVFQNTGVIKRHGVMPIEWYFEPRGWPERTQAFLEGGAALFIDVARTAMQRANLASSEIDTVVSACSTGIATPSLEARIAGKLGVSGGCLACAGVRSRVCRRSVGPVRRVGAGAGAPGDQRALRGS